MNLFTGEASDEYFGSDAPPAVRRLLAQAAEAPVSARAALLWTAQASAPDCLAVYYLLYKFHAQQREFDLAERAALRGLAASASLAGLAADWRSPVPEGVDFHTPGPARFWLFTLKALAFISLRSGRPEQARVLLGRIQALDPSASVGGEVIEALLRNASP